MSKEICVSLMLEVRMVGISKRISKRNKRNFNNGCVSDEYKAKLRRRNASQLGDSNTLEQVVEAVDKDMQTM